jgi:hypothetical protein
MMGFLKRGYTEARDVHRFLLLAVTPTTSATECCERAPTGFSGRGTMTEPSSTGSVATKQGASALRRCCFAAVLALVCGGAWYVGYDMHTSVEQPGALEAEPGCLDFGEVWEDRAFPWTMRVRNVSGREIAISGINASCGCARITPSSLRIPAGEQADFTLSLDLRFDHQQALANNFAVDLVPILDGERRQSVGWTVRGRVRRLLSVEPTEINLDDGLLIGQEFPTPRIKVKAHAPLAKVVARCPKELGEVLACNPRPGDTEFEFALLLNPSLTVGAFEFGVMLEPTSSEAGTLPISKIPVRGVVRNLVRAIPEHLALGVRKRGDLVEETVVFEARSPAQSFEIVGHEEKREEVSVAAEDKANKRFRVKTRITTGGPHTEVIRFRVQFPGQEGVTELPYNVRYHGIE